MLNRILAVACVLLFAGVAHAIDTNKYPHTLVDQTCTDDYNVPAAYTPGPTRLDGGSVVSSTALVQLSGTSDTFCDNDSRILTGAITADTLFGPFILPEGAKGVFFLVDADTYVEDGVGTSQFVVQFKRPHDGAMQWLESTANITASGDKIYQWGSPAADYGISNITDELLAPPMREYYLWYNEITATSITMNISQVPYY